MIRRTIQAIIMLNGKYFIGKKKGKWRLVRGGVEKGETDLEALKREIKEETNLDLDVVVTRVPRYEYDHEKHFVVIPYFVVCKGDVILSDGELADWKLVSADEAKEQLFFVDEKTSVEIARRYERVGRVAYMVKQLFENEGSGHDWWHIYRVWKMARKLAKEEEANVEKAGIGALLHEMDDWKLNIGGKEKIHEILRDCGCLEYEDWVYRLCDRISFKGARVVDEKLDLEGQIVQDADRLDAIGAIGVARTFAYGGRKGRLIYDPFEEPKMHESEIEYKSSKSCTINHFYEKLLLLKDRMNTETAKKIAERRHRFMEVYLDEFEREWNEVDH